MLKDIFSFYPNLNLYLDMPLKLTLLKKQKLVFEEYTDPPISANSVFLRTVYSGVSHGSETMLFKGNAPKFEWNWDSEMRHFQREKFENNKSSSIGYESVARVERIGVDTQDWNIGDLVWIDAPHRETHILDLNKPTPYMRFSSDTDPKQIALFALSRVSLGGVHDVNPSIGEAIGVCGLGVVGLMCIQLLKKAGVRSIVGIDSLESRLSIAEEFGALPINYAKVYPAQTIKEKIGSLDAVIETSGSYTGLTTAIKCVSPMGRVVVVSSYGNQSEGIYLGHEFHRNRITLIPSMTINDCTHPKYPLWNLERLNQEAAHLLTDGTLSTDKLITEIIPFSNAINAFETVLANPNPPLKILFSYE